VEIKYFLGSKKSIHSLIFFLKKKKKKNVFCDGRFSRPCRYGTCRFRL
jgi:hypothetical protein